MKNLHQRSRLKTLNPKTIEDFQPSLDSPMPTPSYYPACSDILNKQSLDISSRIHLSDFKLSFNKAQLHQYNYIEISIFQLFKYTKSQLLRLSSHKVKTLIENIQQISDQLQKFCKQIGILAIYQLFQRIKLCLVGISLYLLDRIQQKNKEIKKNKQSNLSNEYKSVLNLFENDNKNSTGKPKQTQKIKLLKLGGVHLYNQNYENHIQWGNLFQNVLCRTQQLESKKKTELENIQKYVNEIGNKKYQQINTQKQNIIRSNQLNTGHDRYFDFSHDDDMDEIYGMPGISGDISEKLSMNVQGVSGGIQRAQKIYRKQKNQNMLALSNYLKNKQKIYLQQKQSLLQIIQQKQLQIQQYRNSRSLNIKPTIQTEVQTQLSQYQLQQQHKYNELKQQLNKQLEKNQKNIQLLRKKNVYIAANNKKQIDMQVKVQILYKELICKNKQIQQAKNIINNLHKNAKNKLLYTSKIKAKVVIVSQKSLQQQQQQNSIKNNIKNSFQNKQNIQEKQQQQQSIINISEYQTSKLIRSQKIINKNINKKNTNKIYLSKSVHFLKSNKIINYHPKIHKQDKQVSLIVNCNDDTNLDSNFGDNNIDHHQKYQQNSTVQQYNKQDKQNIIIPRKQKNKKIFNPLNHKINNSKRLTQVTNRSQNKSLHTKNITNININTNNKMNNRQLATDINDSKNNNNKSINKYNNNNNNSRYILNSNKNNKLKRQQIKIKRSSNNTYNGEIMQNSLIIPNNLDKQNLNKIKQQSYYETIDRVKQDQVLFKNMSKPQKNKPLQTLISKIHQNKVQNPTELSPQRRQFAILTPTNISFQKIF